MKTNRMWPASLPLGLVLSLAACGEGNRGEVVRELANSSQGAVDVPVAAQSCPVADMADVDRNPPSEWRTFRAAHPYHIQAVALGRPGADGTRLLVLSEPPPWVCASTLRALAPELHDLHIQQWRMGYNGWVRDVTVRLPRLDSLQLGLLLQDVHRQMFGTTYKAQTLDLAANPASSRPALDLTVTAAELNRWLLLDRETFGVQGATAGVTLQELLAGKRHGVHFSTVPGLVLWILPRHRNIAVYGIDARRWALDADVVLGAVADSASVAIVGRERVTPVESLPPLRVETILQLAAASTEHLAQSYERTFVLSGKTDDETDWAPIYLSPELIDTEYGSLLNLTDQLLKSWSQHGDVQYVNFPYRSPGGFPFDQALSTELNVYSLTFNWNTKGAGYVTEGENLSVYALNRTGALPVSYFAGDDQSENDATLLAEQRAYGYFASVRDPNLARVVQYAALYQLFRKFGVDAAVGPPGTFSNPRRVLAPRVRDLLQQFAQVDSSEFATVERPDLQEQLAEAHRAVTLLVDELGEPAIDGITRRLVQDRGDGLDDAALVARVAPNGELSADASADDQAQYFEMVTASMVEPVLAYVINGEDRSGALRDFENASPAPTQPWIHTASVVLSYNVADQRLVGGHNLDAAVTEFRTSSALARGEVRVVEENGRRIILANEEDIAKMSGNLRTIAGTQDDAALESHLSALLRETRVPAIRPRQLALSRPALPGRGLVPERNTFLVGFEATDRPLTALERRSSAFLASRNRAYTGITRLRDGSYEMVLGSSGEVVRAPNIVSALDVATTQPMAQGRLQGHQYQLYGFSELDAAAFSRDAEIAMRRRGRSDPDRIASVIMRDGADEAAALNAATRELDFSTARVRAVRETQVEIAGEAHRAFQIDLEVTTRSTRQPLLMRIWVFFTEGLARPAIDLIQARLASILDALGRETSADVAAALIRTELKKSFGSIEHVRTEFDDVVLVYNSPAERDGPQRYDTTG